MTLDGSGTIHGMGEIICVTPHDAVLLDDGLTRASYLKTAQGVREAGHIELLTVSNAGGLRNVPIQDVHELNPISTEIVPLTTDVVWLYSKWINDPTVFGWNGFMGQMTLDQTYDRSKVIALPFINNIPSDLKIIYTSLMLASEKSEKVGKNMFCNI